MTVCVGPCEWQVPRKSPNPLGWKGTCCPSSPAALLAAEEPLVSPSSWPSQCCSPVLVERVFLVEALVMDFHVAQARVVIGVNKGQMNLEAEKGATGERGWDLGKKSANQA